MNPIKKTIMFALAAALAVASLPFVSVLAAGTTTTSTPAPQKELSNDRLEQIWAHQERVYNRFGRSNKFILRAQRFINLAKAKGKNVSALQTALDAYQTAVRDAQLTYDSMKGIVISHPGFDKNGIVTNHTKAQDTVTTMRGDIRAVKSTLNGTGKALHQAIKNFREANPHL